MITFNQEIANELKTKPLSEQVKFLLEYFDTTSNEELNKNKELLLEFEELLKALKRANMEVKDTNGKTWGDDWYQLRIDRTVEILNSK